RRRPWGAAVKWQRVDAAGSSSRPRGDSRGLRPRAAVGGREVHLGACRTPNDAAGVGRGRYSSPARAPARLRAALKPTRPAVEGEAGTVRACVGGARADDEAQGEFGVIK